MSCLTSIYERERVKGLVITGKRDVWGHISNFLKLILWRTDMFSNNTVLGAIVRVGCTDCGAV